MRRLAVGALLVLGGCTQLRPVVTYTCMGCQGLIASGVCRSFTVPSPETPPIPVPECGAEEILVVENWDKVCKEGATPVLTCEKP